MKTDKNLRKLLGFIERKKERRNGLTRKIGRRSMGTLSGFSEAVPHNWCSYEMPTPMEE